MDRVDLSSAIEERIGISGKVPVNLCPALGTVLANGEVVDGVSERGGHPVIINVWHCVSLFITKQPMRQWMLKITAYADCLLEDLVALDWPESVKEMQRNRIGRSEGAEMDFHVLDEDGKEIDIKTTVYTTGPDIIVPGSRIIYFSFDEKFEAIAPGLRIIYFSFCDADI
ncbi:hypothetical protein GH714_000738 [Hevea brasiliensis]|uniref:leucine--tRNA ligase n=1 Tax=Hevea brasiliensis TaxID=3981 RepID=A0A6A6LU64_HEVBR|nr:hypothetical protein GH714_000738 [Hevea brasiliensis]